MGVKKTGKGRRKLGRKKRRMRARIRHRKGWRWCGIATTCENCNSNCSSSGRAIPRDWLGARSPFSRLYLRYRSAQWRLGLRMVEMGLREARALLIPVSGATGPGTPETDRRCLRRWLPAWGSSIWPPDRPPTCP